MKHIVTFLGLIAFTCFKAQTLTIETFTVLPANPTTNDNVMVLTKVEAPYMGAKVGMSQSTAGTFTHNLTGCYWLGMLTATQTYVDTFNLGPLPAGLHSVFLVAKASSSQTSCVVTSSSSATTSFVVTGIATGLKENTPDAFRIWPNPAKDRIHVSPEMTMKKASVWDAGGRLIKEFIPEQPYLNIVDLNRGLYFLRLEGETGAYYYSRFVKISE